MCNQCESHIFPFSNGADFPSRSLLHPSNIRVWRTERERLIKAYKNNNKDFLVWFGGKFCEVNQVLAVPREEEVEEFKEIKFSYYLDVTLRCCVYGEETIQVEGKT